MIFVDSPDSSIQASPFIIESFRPDVFAQSRKFDREVIGEAKTPKDLDTNHTKQQLEAFMRKTADSTNHALILATQWDYVRYANSILKRICDCLNIALPNYAILDQFGNVVVKSNDWI